MKLFHATSVEAAARVAQLAGPDDVARIRAALQKFENSPLTHVMLEVEESLTRTLDNPLIDLILLSTKAFSCWEISGSEDFVQLDRVYLTETRKLADAIAQRDALGAAAAQDAKYRRLAEVWGHYVRADGAGSYYRTAC
jgi:DNA-binding FadR family transcriptional regulator